MSAPSAIAWGVGGCLLMAGLPVWVLIGGATRSASCAALNSRSPDASPRCLDESFQEWCCGFDGRSWRFGRLGVVCCDASLFCCCARLCSPEDACVRVGGPRGCLRAGSLASALAFSKLVERDARGELAAANSPWGEIRSSRGVFVHFDSPGAAAALRAGLEREEKLSKAGRRRRAPIDRAECFRAHRRHA